MMAIEVQKTVAELLVEHGGLGAEEARAYVLKMIQDKRYVADVWS